MEHGALVLLIAIHVLFDFVFQTREVAKNKSSNFNYLAPHLFILFIGLVLYTILSHRYTIIQGQFFVLANILAHGVIDWNIWNIYKKYTYWQCYKGKRGELIQAADQKGEKYRYWDDSVYYNFIAVDQALHGLCYIIFDYIVKVFL